MRSLNQTLVLTLDLYFAAVLLQVAKELLHFFRHHSGVLQFFDLFRDFPIVLDVAVLQQQRVFDGVVQGNPAIVVLHDYLVDVIGLNLGLWLIFLAHGAEFGNRPGLCEYPHDGGHDPIHGFAQVFGHNRRAALHFVAVWPAVVAIKRQGTLVAQLTIFHAQAVGPVRLDDGQQFFVGHHCAIA